MAVAEESINIQKNAVNKVVVLGGSFNPPTIAHSRLLCAALDATGADLGIFVPAPFAYVQRKLKKAGHKEEAMSDAMRLELLRTVCRGDGRLRVDDCEMCRTEKGFTYETLEAVARKYPEAEVSFLTGSDKLHILPRWHRIDEFLQRFCILTAKRNGEDPKALLEENPYLRQHRERFRVFLFSDDMEEVSSAAARRMLREGNDEAEKLLPEGVWEYLRSRWIPGDSIRRFRGEHDFLSNFYTCRIEYEGLVFQNAEAAFQAQKCRAQEEKKAFQDLPPGQAKRTGRKVLLRPDWEEAKLSVMEEIVRAKFAQNPQLAKRLLSTGEHPLAEGNTWGDVFWGVSAGKGENHLGRILMKIRGELR